MAVVTPAAAATAVLVVLLGGPLFYALRTLLSKWLRACRARRIFEAQGIKCLPRRAFLSGNLKEFGDILAKTRALPMPRLSHDTAPYVMPHLFAWSKTYGERFAYWFGFQPRYVLTHPDQAKEVLSTKSGHFKKVPARPDTRDLVGDGLIILNGEKWAKHRRILSPAFFLEKLKGMAPIMVKLTVDMTQTWGPSIDANEAIDVAEQFQNLTADIIAHTAFGSSFAEGKLVFEIQHRQQEIVSKLLSVLYIPGSCFLPTTQNRYRKDLNDQICRVLSQIIQKRLASGDAVQGDGYGDDLLGLMLSANKGQLHGNQRTLSMELDEIIDECKTFYFGGHETTAALLTFLFMLLAIYPEWQERLRQEILEVCGKTELPATDSLNHLKLVGMVVNEALRLYPAAPVIQRTVDSDMKLGQTLVPAGSVIVVPIIVWHQDERFWGSDAKQFRPERFEEGISKACKVPGAYMPFSYGPRNCIGQLFANIEAKMVVATILQRYRFSLSSKYVHAPITTITLKAKFGMPIIFEKLQ